MEKCMDKELALRKVPELMEFENGSPVKTLDDWLERKKEILKILESNCYGVTPDINPEVTAETMIESNDAYCGKALHQRVNISVKMDFRAGGKPSFANKHTSSYVWDDQIKSREILNFPLNIIKPKNLEKPPMFLFASFSPVLAADNVPIEEILDQGYGIISFYYQDITPDKKDDYRGGNIFYGDSSDSTEWGAIAKWAWAMSRIMDYLETLDWIDSDKVAVCGASRLGKTALWAGVNDERFKLVIPMISGTGGAALYRENIREGVNHMIKHFPYWFCPAYSDYMDKDYALPFDSHFVLSMIAPRNLYIFSGEADVCVDYRAEYLAMNAINPVYKMYGKKGFAAPDSFPEPDVKFHDGEVGYHLRWGPHCISRHDWNAVIEYRNKHNI